MTGGSVSGASLNNSSAGFGDPGRGLGSGKGSLLPGVLTVLIVGLAVLTSASFASAISLGDSPAHALATASPEAQTSPTGVSTPVLPNTPTPTPAQARRAVDAWLNGGLLVAAPLLLLVMFISDLIRPGSFQRGGLRGVQPHPWYIWLFAGLVIYMSMSFGVGFAAQAPWLTGGAAAGSVRYTAVTQLCGFGAGILTSWIMTRLLAAGAGGAGLAWQWRDILVGLGAFVLIYPIVYATQVGAVWAYQYYQGTAPDPMAHQTLKQITSNANDPWAWGITLAAVLGAPIVEEVLYRGMLQSAVLKLTGGAWSAILLTSLIFAGVHYSVVPPHTLPVLFVLSVGLGAVLERTKKLGACIVVHAAFNTLNVALALSN